MRKQLARVVELVDTLDLKSSERLVRAGSSPALSTESFVRLDEAFFLKLNQINGNFCN
jgi:hypothetical protein